MDTELRLILERQGFQKETIEWLQDQQCLSVSVFCTWADDLGQWTKIRQPSPKASVPAEVPRVKAAWKKALLFDERRSKREAEGLAPEEVDDPLPSHVYKYVTAVALAFYNWKTWDSFLICCDGQFGRFRSDFQAYQPSSFAVNRIQSLGASQRRSAPKKSRVADRVSVLVDGDDSDVEGASDLWSWCGKLETMTTTFGIAGAFQVPFPLSGPSS